jgi:hypothetical protein
MGGPFVVAACSGIDLANRLIEVGNLMLSQVPSPPEPPEPGPRGVVVPYRWLAGAADAALVGALIKADTNPAAAGLLGIGLLLIPWLVLKASQGRQE